MRRGTLRAGRLALGALGLGALGLAALGLAATPCASGPRGPGGAGAGDWGTGNWGTGDAARTLEGTRAAPAAGALADDGKPLRAGVTTHFAQGWPARLMDSAASLGAGSIRDSVAWAQVEREPGHYGFTPANSGHVGRACAAGMTVLLGLEPRHPLYDGGQTVFTPAGQAAFARYVRALAGRWPGCVVAMEIGNEINGRGGMTGPAATNRIAAHVSLLKAVWQAVKPAHPHVALLGGSTNTIATGFLARLFAAGALQWVDGIAVHPYRPEPEGMGGELTRLRAAMRRAGAERPIWATEFSSEFADPAAAPAFYLKAIALMESAGVARHYWYALADQPGFPTMGLVRLNGGEKPAARAFAFAARTLSPLGPARRVDHGDPALLHFRFGAETHVVWGAPRGLRVAADARAFTADGRPIPVPASVNEEPVVIRGAATVGLGPRRVLADSFHGHGAPPLAWFARRDDGTLLPLGPVDWEWTSYLGNAVLPLFAANRSAIGTAPGIGTVVRYAAPPLGDGQRAEAEDGALTAAICLRPAANAARATAALVLRGRVLWQAPVGAGGVQALVPAQLGAGDRLDLVLSPMPGAAAGRFRYRLRIWRGAGAAGPC